MAGKNTKDITVRNNAYILLGKGNNETCGVNLKNGLNENLNRFYLVEYM